MTKSDRRVRASDPAARVAPARRRSLRLLLGIALLPACGEATEPTAATGALVHGSAADGIVYVHPGEGNTDIWRARLSDGATRPLTQTPESDERWPFWSSSASRLVFERLRAAKLGGAQLVLWDPEGGRESPLPVPRARRQTWAAWAPSGARLIFAFRSVRGVTPAEGVGVVDVTSGERVLLAGTGPGSKPYFRPELSPGGDRAVAQRSDLESDRSELWVLEAGAAPRRLLGRDDTTTSKGRFTRDGTWIVFMRQETPDAPGDVMLIRPDGSELRALASTPESDDHSPRPCPVRDEIAFISDRDGKEDVFVTDLAGTALRNLTQAIEGSFRVPRWSPDGERLVLLVRPTGMRPSADREVTRQRYEVAVIDRQGRLLLRTPGYSADFMPPWE
ncbi:MAG: PD40 domain-containing protein [Deltaproteobacteria bacterium]|nr:MAG: PD40 domain-containing protein [Deltaproteobacteria bacterium]